MGGPDFYVKGVCLRNRAFERDEVAFKVLPPEEWEVKGMYSKDGLNDVFSFTREKKPLDQQLQH